MGEASIKDRMVKEAVAELQNGKEKPVEMRVDQAIVLQAMSRNVSTLMQDANFMGQLQQKEAVEALRSAAEHLDKFAVRFLAESQRSIIIPKPQIQGP